MTKLPHAIVLAALLAPLPAVSQQRALAELPTLGEEATDWSLDSQLDQTHAAWSRRVMDLGVRLDRLFGGDEIVPDRSSYLRTSIVTRFEQDGIDAEPRLRARLALPNTERRLSLILEDDGEDRFETEGAEAPSPPLMTPATGRGGGFAAGLRYLREFSEVLEFDADAGVRVRWPPDPFVRARIGHSRFAGEWEFRATEEVFWREQRGFGSSTVLIVQRPLPGPRLFRSVSAVDWYRREERFYYAQDLILSHEFDALHAVQARIGARAQSDPHRFDNWFVNIGWRRNIYRHWLFAEIRPELLFRHEDDFRAEPRLFLTLEAYFGALDWLEEEAGR